VTGVQTCALPISLEQAARRLAKGAVLVEREPRAALERAWSSGPLACVAGSIFLVGDVIADLERATDPGGVNLL